MTVGTSLSPRRWLAAALIALAACNGPGDLLLGRDTLATGGSGGSGGQAGGPGASGASGAAGAAGAAGPGGSSGSSGQSGAGGSGAAGAAGSAGSTPGMFRTGVNLSGAENASSNPVADKLNYVYFYPTAKELDYYQGKGLTTIRLPFHWKRMQPTLMGDLDATQLGYMDKVVGFATDRAMHVILDVHNKDALYDGQPIGGDAVPAQAFADFWGKMAAHYKGNPLVAFDLLNEPLGISPPQWLGSANAALAAIRQAGATNLVLVPGVKGGAGAWFTPVAGSSNAETMLGVVDPGDHFVFEVHQYLDADASGLDESCVSATIGSERLGPFTAWLEQHGHRAFLGEIGAAYDTTCLSALDDALTHLDQHRDVWSGWAYWAGGPVFKTYYSSVEPVSDTEDRPPMAVLVKHAEGTP